MDLGLFWQLAGFIEKKKNKMPLARFETAVLDESESNALQTEYHCFLSKFVFPLDPIMQEGVTLILL